MGGSAQGLHNRVGNAGNYQGPQDERGPLRMADLLNPKQQQKCEHPFKFYDQLHAGNCNNTVCSRLAAEIWVDCQSTLTITASYL